MAEQNMGAAPPGTRWEPAADREVILRAQTDALALEHGRVKQDKPQTRSSALPPSLRPATRVSTTGDTTWSQNRKRPVDAAIGRRLDRDSKGSTK
jgi:hypothetical protein